MACCDFTNIDLKVKVRVTVLLVTGRQPLSSHLEVSLWRMVSFFLWNITGPLQHPVISPLPCGEVRVVYSVVPRGVPEGSDSDCFVFMSQSQELTVFFVYIFCDESLTSVTILTNVNKVNVVRILSWSWNSLIFPQCQDILAVIF